MFHSTLIVVSLETFGRTKIGLVTSNNFSFFCLSGSLGYYLDLALGYYLDLDLPGLLIIKEQTNT